MQIKMGFCFTLMKGVHMRLFSVWYSASRSIFKLQIECIINSTKGDGRLTYKKKTFLMHIDISPQSITLFPVNKKENMYTSIYITDSNMYVIYYITYRISFIWICLCFSYKNDDVVYNIFIFKNMHLFYGRIVSFVMTFNLKVKKVFSLIT